MFVCYPEEESFNKNFITKKICQHLFTHCCPPSFPPDGTNFFTARNSFTVLIYILFTEHVIFLYDGNNRDHSPSPLRGRYLGSSFVSLPVSLLLLWHGESSSVSSSLRSRSPSDIGDTAGETSSRMPSNPEWFPEFSVRLFFPPSAPSATSHKATSFPSLSAASAGAPGSARFVGLEGFEGLQLPREPSTELGLECREREGVSGSLILVHGAP